MRYLICIMKRLLLMLIVVVCAGCESRAPIEVFTFSRILNKMALENKSKSILIFYDSQCPPCNIIANDIESYTSRKMKEIATITKIDIGIAGNTVINQLTNNYSMPLTLVVDKELNLIGGIKGILDSPTQYRNKIDSILSNKGYITNISNRDNLNNISYKKFLENTFKAKYSFEKNETDNVLNYLNITDSIAMPPFTIYLRAKVERSKNNRQDATDSLLRVTLQNVDELTEYIYEDILNEIEFMLRNDLCNKITKNTIVFNSRSHNFGLVELRTKSKANFHFSNLSNDSVSITNIKLSCNCLGVEYNNKIVKPKNDGYFTIIYEADKLGITSSVAIIEFSNGNSYPIIIRGEVIGKGET